MLRFIASRIASSLLILFLGSVLMFVLVIRSDDPLKDLRQSRAENREEQIARITDLMRLNDAWYERYWDWLTGVSKCFVLQCDLGTTRAGTSVNTLLLSAAGSSLRLVTVATFIAIFIGVLLGVLSAIRQYSGFDYAVTFGAFLFFSLPVFWAAVLLKEFGAIRFNDWISDPSVSVLGAALLALILGAAISSVIGGDWRRRGISAGASAVFIFAAVLIFDMVGWWRNPALGLPLIILIALGALASLLILTVGLENRRILYAGLSVIAIGAIMYFVLGSLLEDPTWTIIFGLLAVTIVVSGLIGYFTGGFDRRAAMWVCIGTGVTVAYGIFMDQLLRNWGAFLSKSPGGRPISTIGSGQPDFDGNFWEQIFNWGTQLVLPTIVLTVVSLASYSRYARGSMLETINQDYIRTARAKGLSERLVITRHALRNALIPITTIVAFDFASLLGGAVVTERVFGWSGLGAMFQAGLADVDPAPVMAYFLIAGTAAIVMNGVADIAYAFLDPRIRR